MPIAVKLNVALCDAHKEFDYRNTLAQEDKRGVPLFESIAELLEATGKVRPDIARTELVWESTSVPFNADWQVV